MTALAEPRDPAWGEAERLAFTRFRDAGRDEVTPRIADHEARGAFDRGSFARLGALGLYALAAELRWSELFAALEGLATGCDDAAFTVSIVAHAVAITVLVEMGTAEARAALLPALVAGEALAAVANAEPGGGTNVMRVLSRARPRPPGFLLSARKRSITNIGEAGVVLVSARRTDLPRERGLAVFALAAASPGCHQRRGGPRLGLRTSPTGDLLLRNVELPAAALLGDAVAFFRRCFALDRLMVGAIFVGALRRALRRALGHLDRRPGLASHQHVQQRVVEIRAWLGLLEALLHRARAAYLSGASCEAELSTLKWQGADWALAGAEHVVRLLGARGYAGACGPEKDVRDLLGLTLLGGTSELHKGVVFAAAAKGD